MINISNKSITKYKKAKNNKKIQQKESMLNREYL